MPKKIESVDMSPVAVAGRIDDLRALYKLMLTLREVKILGPVAPPVVSTDPDRRGP